VKHLDGISDDEIVEFNIPTGVPRLYELGEDLEVRRADYLGDPAEIAAKAQAVAEHAGRN
jgi:2,3-bisphosphoglycerate-dependent phosphoglycerate mutase